MDTPSQNLQLLSERFGDRLQQSQPLARFTASRIGGPADALLEVELIADLAEAVSLCWYWNLPYVVIGGGSNILVSDLGVRGLVVVNRARAVQFETGSDPVKVWAESGANLGVLARQAAGKGLAGLEWAAGIPGTLGGAIVGNAGAHGNDMNSNLHMAEILHRIHVGREVNARREEWPAKNFAFSYRSSLLKLHPKRYAVLSAWLNLQRSTPEMVQARIDELSSYRRKTQPPGASMGSMFKNPPGDYAGRLIEAAGLKGIQIGGAHISPLHANFFVNDGRASARDVHELILLAQRRVEEKFGVHLELEVELVGEW